MRERLGRGPSGLIFSESFQTVSGGAAAVSWPCRTPTYPSDHLLSTGQAVAMTSLSEASPNVLITPHTHTHKNACADVRTFMVSKQIYAGWQAGRHTHTHMPLLLWTLLMWVFLARDRTMGEALQCLQNSKNSSLKTLWRLWFVSFCVRFDPGRAACWIRASVSLLW